VNTTARRIRSTALATLALTAGLLGSACSSGGGPEAIASPTSSTTAQVSTTVADSGSASTAPSSTTVPAVERQPAQVIRSDHDLVVHSQPTLESDSRTIPAQTEFGSALALLVTDDSVGGWMEVLVPGRPTGATAWLPLEGSGASLRTVTLSLEVDLTARTLTLLDGDQVLLTTPVAIGSADAPTPTGVFSITDKLQDPDPNGAYGPFALGLSGRSEVLTDFAGGDGQIGIHGTNDPSSIGQDVSHGCIRVPNEVITHLNEVLPLGTPVVVR